VGESSQARVYDEAQECANRFREYCLAHSLLDFSLQYDTFTRYVWPLPACRELLLNATYTSSPTMSRKTRRWLTTSCWSGCPTAVPPW